MFTFVKFFVVGLSMVNAQLVPFGKDACYLSECVENCPPVGFCDSSCDGSRQSYEVDLYGYPTESGTPLPCEKCCSFTDVFPTCSPCTSNCDPDFDFGANGCLPFESYLREFGLISVLD